MLDDESSRAEYLLSALVLRPFLDLIAARYADAMAELVELAALPYYESKTQVEALLRSLEGGLPIGRGFARERVPMAATLIAGHASLDAYVDLARIGLLLEAHQAQHGAAPAGLEAIAPALGGTLPLDPFTGESYVYRPLADGFVLYSLGFNGTDDQGVHNDAHGDIVWRGVPAEQDEADRTDE
jgi:hypothetical protein